MKRQFGEPLTFEELPSKRASIIALYRDGEIYTDRQTLEEIKNCCIEKLLKFKKVFGDKLNLVEEKQRTTRVLPIVGLDV